MQDFLLSRKIARLSVPFLVASVLLFLAGCSNNSTGTGSTSSGTTPASGVTAVATLQLSATPTTIKTDGTSSSTITVTAVDAKNAVISGATIAITADTGLLAASTLTTLSTGSATTTFTSGTANRANRIANITATAGTASALQQVQIVGSKLTLSSTTTSLPSTGTSPATLTITAVDAGNNPISGATVTLTQTGTGTVTFNPASGTTNALGQLAVTVAGATVGTVTVNATAAGATAPINFTVAASASTFGISLVTLNGGTGVVPVNPKTTAMHIGDSLLVTVTAPSSSNVTFATTIGTWLENPGQQYYIAPASGTATATLKTGYAGLANVQVYDTNTPALSDTMTVGMTALTAASIRLQASPVVIPKSVGTALGYSNLTATVYDASGAPVGDAPVAFSIVSGTGTNSGETISPVVVFSASTTATGLALGAAPTTFTSGSLSSGGAGVQVRATVVGSSPLIATTAISGVPPVPPTSTDAAIHIGGTAGSVAFGLASKIIDAGGTSTIYSFPFSVLVADSNGSPAPLGTVVNISTWPIAWSTGSPCSIDADSATTGTFYNEDANQNLVLDTGEDGVRRHYYGGATVAGGTKDGKLTPPNSYGGTVVSTNAADLPGTATTDASGVATFNLTYTKSSALWIIDRVQAQTVVQGSPAVGQLDWRLEPSAADDAPPSTCYLPPSPFNF